jgi:CHASE2 domain-containing sensor protein
MAGKKKKKNTQRPAVTKVAEPTVAAPTDQSATDEKTIQWRWRLILTALAALSILILFLSWIKFFDLLGLDHRLQDTLISYVGSSETKQFDSRVVLILVDKDEKTNPPIGTADPSHRKYHAQLVRSLSSAGASVVVFDVLFQTNAPEVDADFAKAIQEAEAAGTKIVVGAFLPPGIYEAQLAGPIKAAVGDHWGIVDGGTLQKSDARFIRLAAEKSKNAFNGNEQPVIPSLALQAVRLLRYPNQATSTWFSPLAGEVRLRNGGAGGQLLDSIPVNNEMYLLVDLPGKDEITHYTYQNILAHFADYAANFKDKIVVIGYQSAKDILPGSDSEPRYGAEIHATAMSTLLTGVYIRPLPILYHYLAIVALVAIAAFLQIRFSKWMTQMQTIALPLPPPINKITIPTPILVISLIYILFAVIAFKALHIVFYMSYHLAALILTYFLFVLGRSWFIRK